MTVFERLQLYSFIWEILTSLYLKQWGRYLNSVFFQKLALEFLEGFRPADEFLEGFIKKRTEAHIRRTKSEKLEELLESQRSRNGWTIKATFDYCFSRPFFPQPSAVWWGNTSGDLWFWFCFFVIWVLSFYAICAVLPKAIFVVLLFSSARRVHCGMVHDKIRYTEWTSVCNMEFVLVRLKSALPLLDILYNGAFKPSRCLMFSKDPCLADGIPLNPSFTFHLEKLWRSISSRILRMGNWIRTAATIPLLHWDTQSYCTMCLPNAAKCLHSRVGAFVHANPSKSLC